MEHQPDIDANIKSGVDQFLQDVRQRFVDDDSANAVLEAAGRLADLIQSEAEALVGQSGGQVWTALRPFLDEQDLSSDLRYVLQAKLAAKLVPSFHHVTERFWHLAEIAVPAKPSLQVARFLDRAARCYLLDLVPECLVMCRGVLENAVNDRYSREQVPWPKNPAGLSTMRARLDEAERRGWLGESRAAELHEKVWARGSKAAHGDPYSVGNARESITLTANALAGLVLLDEGAAT